MVFLFAALGACWRRFFGTRKGIANVTRFWKYLILAIVVLAMYYTKSILDWENWRMYWTLVWFMVFWAIGHGTWYRYWDQSSGAEGRLPWLDKIIWFFVGIEKSRTFFGNAFGMCVRYELTAIPVAFSTSLWFLLAGPIVSLCYIPAGLKKDTRIGEWLAGASIFTLLYLCI